MGAERVEVEWGPYGKGEAVSMGLPHSKSPAEQNNDWPIPTNSRFRSKKRIKTKDVIIDSRATNIAEGYEKKSETCNPTARCLNNLQY